MDVKQILAKFDELIDEAAKVRAEREANVARTGESVISPVGYYRLFSSTIALLTYLQAKTYIDLAHSVRDPNPGILQGILESARREFCFGLISHPRLLLAADSLEEMLEQASHLLANGYKDAACVLIGGTLEAALKSMLENKYPTAQFNPKEGLRKFNDKLYKDIGAYDRATHKLIDGYAEIRNASAHGEYDNYDAAQVDGFLRFTRNFISAWLAPMLTGDTHNQKSS